jgi:hypothetical protein
MTRSGILAALVLGVMLNLLSGCDDVAFTRAENEAAAKYRAIKPGTSLPNAKSALGTPAFELVRDEARKGYAYVDGSGRKIYFDPSNTADRDKLPPELRFFPRKTSAERVLIYSSGTVFGYFGISADIVSFVDVHTS